MLYLCLDNEGLLYVWRNVYKKTGCQFYFPTNKAFKSSILYKTTCKLPTSNMNIQKI